MGRKPSPPSTPDQIFMAKPHVISITAKEIHKDSQRPGHQMVLHPQKGHPLVFANRGVTLPLPGHVTPGKVPSGSTLPFSQSQNEKNNRRAIAKVGGGDLLETICKMASTFPARS